MSDRDNQIAMRLPVAPSPDTLERLFRVFGDELIATEDLRLRYFRNMNHETFRQALGTERIPLPVVTMANSQKAATFVHIRQLGAYIEHRAWQADQQLAERDPAKSQPQ